MQVNRAGRAPKEGLPDEDPVARALGYPYPRHPGPLLFDPAAGARDAHVVDIGPARERRVDGLARPLPVRSVAVRAGGRTVAIEHAAVLVAAGSNGSAVQLARKWRERRAGRPMLIAPAEVSGAVSVYSAHITAYGAVPATLHRAAARAALHVLLMPAEELAHMNATESLGLNYVLAAPAGLSANVEGVVIDRPLAYVSLRGAAVLGGGPTLLADSGGQETGYAAMAQRDMLERVRGHVGHEGGIEEFVRRMIADGAARLAATARLAETGERWALGPDEIVADGR